MPTVDQSAPRRPSAGRSKSFNRPHSRSSSNSSATGGTRNNGLGFTTIGPTPTTSVSGKEKSSIKHSRRRSGGGSAKAMSPHRQSPPTRPSLSRHGSSAKVPTQTLQLTVNEDEDEWESSESGAVTPNPEPIDPTTPIVQLTDPFSQSVPQQSQGAITLTPRLSTRPFPSSEDIEDQPISPTTTETQTHHRSNRTHSRAHSMRSVNRLPLLGHAAAASASIGRVPSYTSPPLTAPPYLSAQSAQAQIASSPPQTPSPPSSPNPLTDRRLSSKLDSTNLRKASFSSTHSASTLPVSKNNIFGLQSEKQRERTMSSISSVSSSAALSSLAAIPANQNRHYNSGFRPPTPPLTSRFPPHPVDEIHPFLPQGYMGMHYSVTQFYDPLRDSFARVAEAKVRSRLH